MQQIKNIVKGPYEPQDNTVIWIDTSNPDAPIVKVHSNGEWKAISPGEIVTEIDENSTDEQYPSAKAVYDAIQAGGGSCPLNILVTGENLGEFQQYGPTTRSGLAEYFGVTEEQLQDLMDGKYCGLVGPNNIVFWLVYIAEDRVTLTSSYQIEIYCLGENQWALGYVWD